MLCLFSWFFWSNWLWILQVYTSEESNHHLGALIFLFGQLLSSIPFLFLISIPSSVVFYFLLGLRDEFSLLMYFMLNFFMCLLVNDGLMLVVVSLSRDVFWSTLTLVSVQVSSFISIQRIYLKFPMSACSALTHLQPNNNFYIYCMSYCFCLLEDSLILYGLEILLWNQNLDCVSQSTWHLWCFAMCVIKVTHVSY